PDGHASTIGFAIASADPDYDGLAVTPITANVTDDQTDLTLVSAVQGAGSASPLQGQVVTLEAVVVGDFQNGDADGTRNLGGFYLQEEDAAGDGDAATSEGIFVFDSAFGVDVNVGDVVAVMGTVTEFFGLTELTSVTSVTVESSGNPLPSAAAIDLSALGSATIIDQNGDFVPDLEAYEGMLVAFTDRLTITEMFNLDRFNEIRLSEGGRPQHFTQIHAPDAAGYQSHLRETGSLSITYDDGLNVQNAAIDNLDGFAPFSTATAHSMGDTITGLTGVLDYQWAGNSASGATWRVRATQDGRNGFQDTNPPDLAPADVGGDVKIASLNVLNFFTTLNQGGNLTSVGQVPRGANNAAEFDRQLEKLVTALVAMDADVVGLIEIENDVTSAPLAFLVDAINERLGAEIYAHVDTGQVGTDAITCAMIYKTSTVAPAGGHAVLDAPEFVDPLGDLSTEGTAFNRPAIAQSFTELATGETFTAIVNHLKSKGSGTGAAADEDQGDGQALSNATRAAAAIALADWLATNPTGDTSGNQILLGDHNAYAREDPIQNLIAAGYDDLAQDFIGPDAHSFVFDGFTGTLDYAFTNGDWTSLVHDVTEWHNNSDEADALDYNTDFGRDPAIFDGSSPLRSSDHDPVIVGLNLVSDVDVYERVGRRLVFEDGWARFDRALDSVGDLGLVQVKDPAAIGDFGHLTLAAEDVQIQAGAPVTGLIDLASEIFGVILRGTNSISVNGNAGDNRVSGSGGGNGIAGLGGADRLFGFGGDDTLEGGAGHDQLFGGAHADRFVARPGCEIEVINDFSQIEGDLIAIAGYAHDEFADIEPLIQDRRGAVAIQLGGGDVLRLRGLEADDLSAADFLFL
ncbi:MAG TPA: ExeM/NucH family extracellular endonuclease, partial [Paracoccaceae bacterium]|nr:ExeM/NucH family extracellular endonuclease [Paracoccaceae bacterium]